MHVYVIICCICRFRGIRDCLVPVTPYLAGTLSQDIQAFASQEQASAKGEGYGYVSCTSDPFISPGRTQQVEEHNRRSLVALIIDPPPMMVDITIMLSWYQLCCRKFLAKHELEEDIKDLVTLGKR